MPEKILAVPLDDTATSYHRVIQPLSYLKNKGWNIEFPKEKSQQLEQFKNADIIYLNCLYAPSAYHFYRELVRKGKKLILDLDDDYFNIPIDSPEQTVVIKRDGSQEILTSSQRIYWMKAFLRLATAVSVTNQQLADFYAPYAKQIWVTPNCVSEEMCRDIPKPVSDTITILWTGSVSHMQDLGLLVKPIQNILKKYPRVRFVCQGDLPFKEIFTECNISSFEGVKYGDYLNLLQEINPDVALMPLQKNNFNLRKSDLKFSQLTLLECASIVSNYGPYEEIPDTAALKVEDDGWESALESLIENPSKMLGFQTEAKKYVSDHRMISNQYAAWEKVINGCTDS